MRILPFLITNAEDVVRSSNCNVGYLFNNVVFNNDNNNNNNNKNDNNNNENFDNTLKYNCRPRFVR